MGSYSYKKHKKSKHSKKHRRHTRRTRYMEGGKVCMLSPYQFNQSGGGKKNRNRKGRHMKGGGFFDFGKLWNPSNPASGGNVIPLSSGGISPAGLGSPASTSAYRPNIQPWPAQNLIRPHEYAIGGRQTGGDGTGGGGGGGGGGGKPTRKLKWKGKGRGRGLRGGGIIDDMQTFGRSIVHGLGSVVNGISGYDNKLYNMNPNPTIQFPRGLGGVTTGGATYNALDLQKIYNSSYADASLK
jgi:hypothetical protein